VDVQSYWECADMHGIPKNKIQAGYRTNISKNILAQTLSMQNQERKDIYHNT